MKNNRDFMPWKRMYKHVGRKTAAVFMLTGALLGSGVLWGYNSQNS